MAGLGKETDFDMEAVRKQVEVVGMVVAGMEAVDREVAGMEAAEMELAGKGQRLELA